MKWGAHEVDGRIAAKAAVKIRAALRQSIDAKRVFELYKESDPAITDNEAQDNARARAWAMLNIRINNNALITALMRTWAEGFLLGEDSAREAIREAREAKKALAGEVDWANWKAGDRATALLIQPPNAFKRLLEKQGVAIKGLDKTGYDRVGTALSRSLRLGLSGTSAAREISNAIGDPSRALTIAITETNRAVSLGAMKTYKEAHLEKMEWAAIDPCPECAQNDGQVIDIGGTFNSGAQQPPAHPHCRCALLPVIPDYETNEAGVVNIIPPETPVPTLSGRIIAKDDLDVESNFQVFRGMDLDAKDLEALEQYTQFEYHDINAELREGISGNRYVPKLDKIMRESPGLPVDTITFRGVSNGPQGDFAKELLSKPIGTVFSDKGYTSTSFDREVAERFSAGWKDSVLLEIKNPAGQKGISVEALVDNPDSTGEYEWLLPRGTKFKIVGKTDSVIQVEIVK